jgi:YidC/Oxa1 family membrane protein insertase
MRAAKPEIEALNARFKSNPNASKEDVMKYRSDMKALYKKYGFSPGSSFIPLLIQMPLFMTFFFALRRMPDKYPELASEGIWWFKDLSVQDPTYALPALCAASFLATIELGGESGEVQSNMKNVMRGLGLIMIPAMAQFPAVLFCYWLPSNLFSFFQIASFKVGPIRRALKLPDLDKAAPAQPSASASPFRFKAPAGSVSAPPPPPPLPLQQQKFVDTEVVEKASSDAPVDEQGRSSRTSAAGSNSSRLGRMSRRRRRRS